ncbi:MAG: aldehyde dehydrogenase family protein [Anaerolineae bacterium]|nr:aldehyde dehydrogenase family protein [Anaerolineae bacterium]
MTRKLKNYIGGEWVEASAEAVIPVENPATCEIMADCPDSTADDVNQAVEAAVAGFEEWRRTPVLSRAQYMHHFKNLVEDNFEKISQVMVMESGKTIDEARE